MIDRLVTKHHAGSGAEYPSESASAGEEPEAHDQGVIGSLTADSADASEPQATQPGATVPPKEQADTGLIDSLIQKKHEDHKHNG